MSRPIVDASAEDVGQLLVLQPVCLRDRGFGDQAVVGVQSQCQRRIGLERLRQPRLARL